MPSSSLRISSCLLLLLLGFASVTEAFHQQRTRPSIATSRRHLAPRPPSFSRPSFGARPTTRDEEPTTVRLSASKENKNGGGGGEKQKLDVAKLIVVFLTPWKNPNSIFLYMFLILDLLGKYNEANM